MCNSGYLLMITYGVNLLLLMLLSLQYLLLVLYNNNAIFMIGVGGPIIGPHTPNHKNGPWSCFPPVLIIGFVQ